MLRHVENKQVTGDSQHGFTKNKLCLGNLAAFYDGVTALVDNGRATDVIYLDLNKAFDTVLHNMLASKLERHGFDKWTTQWIRNWLDGRTKRVAVNSLMLKWGPMTSDIPQGLVQELALFNIVGSMDSRVKCTISKSANNTKLCGVINTLEGRDDIQRDPDRCLRGGLMRTSESSTRPSAESCTWVRATSRTHTGWVERAALRRRTWGCCLTRSSTWPNNVCSQPRRPTISWAASK